jgi:hypothetical protein
VSFKLDIDTPQVEIPIALELLRNDEVGGLIDEFFFELHFRFFTLLFYLFIIFNMIFEKYATEIKCFIANSYYEVYQYFIFLFFLTFSIVM